MTLHHFNNISPFPSDIPTIELPRISLAKILADDQDESARFFAASKDLGFLMLELDDCSEGKELLQDVSMAFELNHEIMSIDDDEKLRRWPQKIGNIG